MNITNPTPVVGIRPPLGQLISMLQDSHQGAAGDPHIWPTGGTWPVGTPEEMYREWQRLRATGFTAMEPLLQRVRESSAVPGQTTLWCLRWHHPATCLLMLYCVRAPSSVGGWLDGLVTEREFTALTEFAKTVKAWPLLFGQARTQEEFLDVLRQTAAVGMKATVLGDWRLQEKEWAEAKAVVGSSPVQLGELAVGPDLSWLQTDGATLL